MRLGCSFSGHPNLVSGNVLQCGGAAHGHCALQFAGDLVHVDLLAFFTRVVDSRQNRTPDQDTVGTCFYGLYGHISTENISPRVTILKKR